MADEAASTVGIILTYYLISDILRTPILSVDITLIIELDLIMINFKSNVI